MPGAELTRRGVLGALLMPAPPPAAVLLDVRTGRVLTFSNRAKTWLAPPGSTLKPFSVLALLESGKLTTNEAYPCQGKLTIANRSFNCSHPPLGAPVRAATAIAYSCNCFVAHFAERFEPGELARFLMRRQLSSAAGRVEAAAHPDDRKLQALGEERVLVTPAGLATMYANLARKPAAAILEGLEGAVEYGTAQLAQIAKVKVAGKTGTVRQTAWFAGFAPSRSPEVAIAVAVAGRSGGSDAAPIAARILELYFAGKM